MKKSELPSPAPRVFPAPRNCPLGRTIMRTCPASSSPGAVADFVVTSTSRRVPSASLSFPLPDSGSDELPVLLRYRRSSEADDQLRRVVGALKAWSNPPPFSAASRIKKPLLLPEYMDWTWESTFHSTYPTLPERDGAVAAEPVVAGGPETISVSGDVSSSSTVLP
jgi:hypothetical protein